VRARWLASLAVVSTLAAACGGSAPSAETSSPGRSTTAASGETATSGGGSSAPSGGSSTGASSGTSPAPATPGTTAPTAAANQCALGRQAPPTGTIDADTATALAFAPDGRLFFAERSGTVRVYQDGAVRDFASVDTVTTEPGGGYSERGLLGLAISPTFSSDHYVYAFYSDTNRTQQHVIRWTDCAGEGTNATNLIDLPSGSDCCHKGGRLAFGPDRKLYVTLGDEHSSSAAQDTSDVRGKVLRYNADGSVPADNPFGPGDPVWAYGFRNPFGIAFSATGQLALTVNGPTGDAGSPSTGYDVVIASVQRGAGYQWPNCYGYSHPLASSSCGSGQVEPDWSSESSTVVPTGATFVDDAGPAGTAGHLVFCTYAAGMRILTPGSPHASVTGGPSNCNLDVKQGPDHALYYSDNSHIYRLG
jgi:glucose/arabinose dehydrogenase